MIYTAETKQKMDSIMEAFAEYIQEQSYFDILYSEKVGYIRIIAEMPEAESPMVIETPDSLVETIIGDVADDLIAEKLRKPLPEEIKAEIYQQIIESVGRIGEDREHYLDLARNYCQNRFEKRADGEI